MRRAMSTDADTVRSISGRLGGRFDSSRTAGQQDLKPSGASSASLPMRSVELPNEATRLLMPPSPGLTVASLDGWVADTQGASPPLMAWIFPALSCAAAYAFYNVSVSMVP